MDAKTTNLFCGKPSILAYFLLIIILTLGAIVCVHLLTTCCGILLIMMAHQQLYVDETKDGVHMSKVGLVGMFNYGNGHNLSNIPFTS